jgi:hypothetical protein
MASGVNMDYLEAANQSPYQSAIIYFSENFCEVFNLDFYSVTKNAYGFICKKKIVNQRKSLDWQPLKNEEIYSSVLAYKNSKKRKDYPLPETKMKFLAMLSEFPFSKRKDIIEKGKELGISSKTYLNDLINHFYSLGFLNADFTLTEEAETSLEKSKEYYRELGDYTCLTKN